MTRAAPSARRIAARQRGVLTLLFALLLPVLLCAAGVALELALVYQRKVQLQNYADAVALAAARSLNGTAAGVNDAAVKAAAAAAVDVHFGASVSWQSGALKFSPTPDAPDAAWLEAGMAAGAPAGVAYASVDTASLTVAPVSSVFLGMLGAAGDVTASARAVAGRAGTRVTPLAVCAMGPATGTRSNTGAAGGAALELLQHGFRFGVSYNLLKLNAQHNTELAEYFLVDPIQPAGAGPAGAVDHTADAVLAPFMCTGTVQLPQVTGVTLRLRRPAAFTLGEQLNSRLGVYGAGALACLPATAPPDTNVRRYNSVGSWMSPAPAAASATPAPAAPGQPYNTMADRASAAGAADYGPLWAYSSARQSANGAAISRNQWPWLYPVSAGALPTAPNYNTPAYFQTTAAYYLAPVQPGLALRRLLVVPLLDCPAPPGASTQAPVLALAQFFLMEQADADGVRGEFAGVVDESTLAGAVELYR
jgi:Flp pilus assembly protein TadG